MVVRLVGLLARRGVSFATGLAVLVVSLLRDRCSQGSYVPAACGRRLSRFVRSFLAGRCMHRRQLSGWQHDRLEFHDTRICGDRVQRLYARQRRTDAFRLDHVGELPMRWLPLFLALVCARPALAALTLDSTTCSMGAIANCPKEHMTQTNCTLANNQKICTLPVSIGAAGPNTLLIAAVSLRYFSGQATSITGMSVGTAANYTTQWTLVPNSQIAGSVGGSATFYAVTARAFTGEVPTANIGCGTSGCPNFEVHAQVIGWSASKLTPGNAAAGSSSSTTPSLTVRNTQIGSQVVFEGQDDSGLNCSQTPTANAINIDTWQPSAPCSGSNFYFSEWLTSPTSSTGGNVTIGLTAPTNVRGAWTAVEVCDSTAPSCPAGSGFVVSGIASPQTAGASSSVTVQAIDAAGNRATGYLGTVRFTSTDALAILPPNYTFQSSDQGIHTFTGLVLKSAGTRSVTATDTVTTSITGTQGGIQVNAAVASTLTVSGFPSPSTAGTAGTVTVQAKDAYGNLATSYAGTVRFTSTDAQATVPAPHTFTAADAGLYSAAVTFRTAGTQSVTAMDTTTSSITGSQSGINVNPASTTSFSVSGIPATVGAGLSSSVNVVARDPYGNVATGYTGTIHFTSSDLQASLPTDYTFLPSNLGTATVSGVVLRTAGTQGVTASDTLASTITGTQSGIAVVAAGASRLAVGGMASPATAGAGGAITVIAQDPYSNVASGYRGSITFSSSDAQAVLPATYAFTSVDAGTRTFTVTLKTAGPQSITATDTVTPTIVGSQNGITVQPAAASSLLVAGIASSIAAGATTTGAVKAKDAYGNVATGYLGTVHFTSTDALATLPANYAYVAADSGSHSFSFSFGTVGVQSVTATDTLNASVTGSQGGITVTDSIPPVWPAGSTLTATALSTTAARLSWTAATDNVGVTGYRVYKDGVLNQTVGGTVLTADVSGLVVGVKSSFQLQAGDAAGNWSAGGPIASVTTTPPDPQLIAPPIDLTVSTTLASATSFLYTTERDPDGCSAGHHRGDARRGHARPGPGPCVPAAVGCENLRLESSGVRQHLVAGGWPVRLRRQRR